MFEFRVAVNRKRELHEIAFGPEPESPEPLPEPVHATLDNRRPLVHFHLVENIAHFGCPSVEIAPQVVTEDAGNLAVPTAGGARESGGNS